jgi:hypothetical protein
MDMNERDALHERGRALEDAYFAARDRELVAALRRRLATEAAEHTLLETFGRSDQSTIEALKKTEAGVEMLTALALLPLVEVAWCDGDVAAAEKQAVLKAAASMEISPDSTSYQLLQNWLEARPAPAAVTAWSEYVRALCGTLDPAVVPNLKARVIGRAEQVAQAAGGFLGLGNKVSAQERVCLDQLAKAFDG